MTDSDEHTRGKSGKGTNYWGFGEILALSKSHWPREEHLGTWEHPVRDECVCFCSSNHRPAEARIKRYTHNDPIMSAVPLTQAKCASKELIATSQQCKGGTDGVKEDFWAPGWWNLSKSGNLISRKTQGHCQECCSLTALCTPLFGSVVKMWTNSGPGRDPLLLLATDATPVGYSKHRQDGRGQVQQTNRLGRAWFKESANMDMQEQTTRGSFWGKKGFLLCDEGKHLQTVDWATSSGKKKIYKLCATFKVLRHIYYTHMNHIHAHCTAYIH